MRLSTAGMHNGQISAILDAQVRMARTQEQITTGKKFQTAAEDPIGATRAAALDRTLADNTQYARNSGIVESRLGYEEQTLSEVSLVLQSARDAALQGANSTLGADERRMLATQVRQHIGELMELANRDDGTGEFLFSGTSTGTRPFAQGTTGVNYQGDLTNRQIRISSTQALADGHSGADVFMNIAERNGTFRTSVAAANTGSASIDNGRVLDASAWVPGNYSLQFSSATDWQVVDDATPVPNVIASGTGFAPGQSIGFLGVSVTVTGTPAAGDSFAVQPARKLDMFAMLDELATTLEGGGAAGTGSAAFANQVGAAIANIDQSLARAVGVRAEVGTRLAAIDQAKATRESEAIDLQSLLSDLRDTDYASAISKLNQQYTGLQAAQKAYSSISQLSLFDYL